jgi:hypothetical protein
MDLCPSRVVLTANLVRYKAGQTKDTLDVRQLLAPHKRRSKEAGLRRILQAQLENPKLKDYCPAPGGAIRPSAVVSERKADEPWNSLEWLADIAGGY